LEAGAKEAETAATGTAVGVEVAGREAAGDWVGAAKEAAAVREEACTRRLLSWIRTQQP